MADLALIDDEVAWLIEDRNPGDNSLYIAMADVEFGLTKPRRPIARNERFSLERYESPVRFTKDANEAIRFARKQDAEAFMRVFSRYLLCPEATEHMWCAAD